MSVVIVILLLIIAAALIFGGGAVFNFLVSAVGLVLGIIVVSVGWVVIRENILTILFWVLATISVGGLLVYFNAYNERGARLRRKFGDDTPEVERLLARRWDLAGRGGLDTDEGRRVDSRLRALGCDDPSKYY